jgi:mRNA interferase HigB
VNLVNKGILERLKKKNRGNIKLTKAVDKLILDIEQNDWDSPNELKQT